MSALTAVTSNTLSKALQRLSEVGIDHEMFCETYDFEPHVLAGALHDENPQACPRLLVLALKLLAVTYEGLADPERNKR